MSIFVMIDWRNIMINNCHHVEAFLWSGTGIDEVDNAIMDLVKLSEIDVEVAKEIADEIQAVLSTTKHRHGMDKREVLCGMN